ncbi:MAG TPA: hypothetical protein VEN81_16440 [Planctomycetota bacterium]|nr:hypothetical protein [Planctomycetota bacterium]
MEETAIYTHNQQIVSARGTLLLAAVGLLCLATGLFTGAALLIPAGLAAGAGLVTGLSRLGRVARGTAYPMEGRLTLLAVTFVNGSLALYIVIAGYIVLRFGV